MRLLWGDYWVKKELEKELSRLGFDLSQKHPDIHIHLFGSPSESYDEDALNLVWLYSHPDQVTIDNLTAIRWPVLRILPLPAHTPGHGIFAHRADARLHRQDACSGPDRSMT